MDIKYLPDEIKYPTEIMIEAPLRILDEICNAYKEAVKTRAMAGVEKTKYREMARVEINKINANLEKELALIKDRHEIKMKILEFLQEIIHRDFLSENEIELCEKIIESVLR